ncbi:hypothetical protein HANVADRAFT_27598, partial [Hanseniaspora valbyensis NRRL Y-1626]
MSRYSAVTTNSYYNGSVVTTYSTSIFEATNSNGSSPYYSTIYFIATPEVQIQSTSTQWYNESAVSTYSTIVKSSVGEDGHETIFTVYLVDRPYSHTEVDSTIAYNGSTTQLSTSYTTFTGDDDMVTIETVVFELTPVKRTEYTNTTEWTEAFTSTYSTDISTLYGNDSSISEIETIYYVYTPEFVSTKLVSETKYWSGLQTTTATSFSTEFGSDGLETLVEYIIVEVVPMAQITSTTTTYWTGDFTETFSTTVVIYTITGDDGDASTIMSTLYYVETPAIKIYSTVTTSYDGASTSTYDTSTLTTTGSDGIPTEFVVYYLETPESTVTS